MSALILLWQVSFPQPINAQEYTPSNDQEIIEQPLSQMAGQIHLPEIADRPQPEAKSTMHISVSAYSSTPDQTSGDPFITASGTTVQDGVIAANFLPIGTRVRFPDHFGNKIFVVEDRMHQRYWYKADIWMPTREAATEWGVRYTTIEIL